MKINKNNPPLTTNEFESLSVLTGRLKSQNLLYGEIAAICCKSDPAINEFKAQGYNIIGYDTCYKPTLPIKHFDTIICNYLLNAIDPKEQAEVLMFVSELLRPTGTAYFAVRHSTCILPFNRIFQNENSEIMAYRHYNQIPHNSDCPFCNLAADKELLCETVTSLAFFDGFPVSKGHTLIIPKRHVASYFDLSTQEQQDLWALVNRCKIMLEKRFNPDGFNVGINVGEAAGQSIFHVHIHIIPRYKGDVENPRGGVRGVIPSKQTY